MSGSTDGPALVWVTRAQPGAEATAARLTALGFTPIVAPVLEVVALPAPRLDMIGLDALAFTSANGVRAFAGLDPDRGLPALCVGEATAAAARNAGFSDVSSADGDVAALADLIVAATPIGSVVGHPCATETAGDLGGLLATHGIGLRAMPIYETRPVETLPQPVVEALTGATLGAVLIHSPKAARTVADLLAPLQASAVSRIRIFAISEAALAPLRPLPFASTTAAVAPDETTLLGLLSP